MEKGETMKLVRFQRPELWGLSPFEQLTDLREEINRLFEAPFGEPTRATDSFCGWTPALDLHEDKDNLVATVELPGVKKEDIDVTVHEGVLSVAGERKQEKEQSEAGTYRSERFYGRFHRTVSLPKPVKADAVKAVYKDGILTVSLPKTEEAKPRQIEVNVN
jgi:HSP20 family protein